MNKQEVIERLNNKLDETFAFQQSFKPLTWAHMECESKANAYMTAINYVEQLDEPQKVKARLAKHWDEDLGDCLWWDFPVEEPPYCGTPLDDDFPRYKTHFTELHIPDEVEESKWVVNEGDLVIRKGEHEAKVYFVESVDDDGILLVNGIKDEFFTDLDERSVGEESINYFYENFRLLAKKENLEAEKV
ncbi:hypothetical protein [Enterococcus avium]|uniref:hypothetical protein n=1 Tax=Enterococcus avium TaxID=33945 RepID=UPI001D0EEBD4|nr:hypothetical protein [Enterococcus avium]